MPQIRIVHPFAVLAVLAAAALALAVPSAPRAADVTAESLTPKIERARKRTWHWQRVMQRRLTPARKASRRVHDLGVQKRRLHVWRARARRAYRHAHDAPHESGFRCIHRYEGPWHANTGNGYYGGLQMDLAFQRNYGHRLLRKKGRANHWTALEQIWVGERALRAGRGFYPWPVSARRCGLI